MPPASAGATAPPMISPKPTTMPVAVAAIFGVTEAFNSGPMFVATTPEIMALSTASNAARASCPGSSTAMAPSAATAMAMQTAITGVRPNRSEAAGTAIMPTTPPSPIADNTKPISSNERPT